MYYKELSSIIAIIIGLFSFIPYLRSIYTGKAKPHMFSWLIWAISTIIVLIAQYEEGGGVGCIPSAFSGLICIIITYMAYVKRTDMSIHKTDWLFLFAALLSVPLWYYTSDPLWTVIILTIIDTLGFGPTIRRTYYFPFDEDVVFYSLYVVRNILSIIALENYTTTTVLFPAVTALATVILVIIILYRRREVNKTIG